MYNFKIISQKKNIINKKSSEKNIAIKGIISNNPKKLIVTSIVPIAKTLVKYNKDVAMPTPRINNQYVKQLIFNLKITPKDMPDDYGKSQEFQQLKLAEQDYSKGESSSSSGSSLDEEQEVIKNKENDETVKILINKIKLLKTNEDYRFGDVIYQKGYIWKESAEKILKLNKYNNTFLKKYLLINTPPPPQTNPKDKYHNKPDFNYLKILRNILNNHNSLRIPRSDELVFHLRTGDVLLSNNYRAKVFKKNYKEIIAYHIKYYNIKYCTFCTAFHYGNLKKKNLWIYNEKNHNENINLLTNLLSDLIAEFKSIKFDIKSSYDIDEDLYYMYKAKYFIKDFGGFSNLISELRKNEYDILKARNNFKINL